MDPVNESLESVFDVTDKILARRSAEASRIESLREIDTGLKRDLRADMNPVAKGLMQGLHGIGSGIHGTVGIAQSIAGKDNAAQRSFQRAQGHFDEADTYATGVQMFGAEPGQRATESWGNFGTWAGSTIGQLVPFVADVMISAAIGGAVGSQVVPGIGPDDVVAAPAGAIAGAGTRLFGRRVLRELVEEKAENLIKRKIVKEATEEATERAARKMAEGFIRTNIRSMQPQITAAARRVGKQWGSTVGAMAASSVVEGGNMWADGMKEGYNNPYSALTLGLISGASETFMGNIPLGMKGFFGTSVGKAANRSLKKAARKGPGPAAQFLWDIVDNMKDEGLQEAFQEILGSINQEINDPNFKIMSRENFVQWAESAAAGALGGAVFGASAKTAEVVRNRLSGQVGEVDIRTGEPIQSDAPLPDPSKITPEQAQVLDEEREILRDTNPQRASAIDELLAKVEAAAARPAPAGGMAPQGASQIRAERDALVDLGMDRRGAMEDIAGYEDVEALSAEEQSALPLSVAQRNTQQRDSEASARRQESEEFQKNATRIDRELNAFDRMMQGIPEDFTERNADLFDQMSDAIAENNLGRIRELSNVIRNKVNNFRAKERKKARRDRREGEIQSPAAAEESAITSPGVETGRMSPAQTTAAAENFRETPPAQDAPAAAAAPSREAETTAPAVSEARKGAEKVLSDFKRVFQKVKSGEMDVSDIGTNDELDLIRAINGGNLSEEQMKEAESLKDEYSKAVHDDYDRRHPIIKNKREPVKWEPTHTLTRDMGSFKKGTQVRVVPDSEGVRPVTGSRTVQIESRSGKKYSVTTENGELSPIAATPAADPARHIVASTGNPFRTMDAAKRAAVKNGTGEAAIVQVKGGYALDRSRSVSQAAESETQAESPRTGEAQAVRGKASPAPAQADAQPATPEGTFRVHHDSGVAPFGGGIIEVQAQNVDLDGAPDGVKFIAWKRSDGMWIVAEASTGLSIPNGKAKTLKKAIEGANQTFAAVRSEAVMEAINRNEKLNDVPAQPATPAKAPAAQPPAPVSGDASAAKEPSGKAPNLYAIGKGILEKDMTIGDWWVNTTKAQAVKDFGERVVRNSVEKAIQEGRAVPAEVLADYPDLKSTATRAQEPVTTISGKMTYDQFEKAGYAPNEVTQAEWVALQRSLRRSLGQSEESGTKASPYADYEEYHKADVQRALKAGEEVDDRVLADYPDLARVSNDTKPATEMAIAAERWDSAKLGVRIEWLKRKGFTTADGKLSRTGEKNAELKWGQLTPASQNVLLRVIKEDYPTRFQAEPTPASNDTKPAPAAPEADTPADTLKPGHRFTDADGREFEVWSNLKGVVEAHPVENGKPVVNRDTVERYAITDAAKLRHSEYKTFPNDSAAVTRGPVSLKNLQADTPAEAAQDVREEIRNPQNPVAKRDPAAIKTDIVAEVEKAIAALEGEKSGPGTVTFTIPGDGTFTLNNTLAALEGFLKRAKAMKTGKESNPPPSRKQLMETTQTRRPGSGFGMPTFDTTTAPAMGGPVLDASVDQLVAAMGNEKTREQFRQQLAEGAYEDISRARVTEALRRVDADIAKAAEAAEIKEKADAEIQAGVKKAADEKAAKKAAADQIKAAKNRFANVKETEVKIDYAALETIPEEIVAKTTFRFINPMRETLALLEKENVDLFKITSDSDLSAGVEELIQKVLDLQKRWKTMFASMSKESQALIRMLVQEREAVELFADYSEWLDRKADTTDETYAAFRARITSEVAAELEGLEGMERAEVLDNYTDPEKWADAIEDRAQQGERIADAVLDSFIGVFGEQRFAQTFRGVAKQDGYMPPSVRAQPGKESLDSRTPQQKAADTRTEKAREDAAIALTKLKGVEERLPGLFIVPKELMTVKRRQDILPPGAGGVRGMLQTPRVTVMEYSEVTGNPMDEGWAVKVKATPAQAATTAAPAIELSSVIPSNEPLIMGRTWDQIKAMQQKDRDSLMLPPVDRMKHIGQIMADVSKFKIPVAKSVVDQYKLTLPEGYAIEGDTYKFTAPAAQTAKVEHRDGRLLVDGEDVGVLETTNKGNGVVEISKLYIDESQQKKGYGSKVIPFLFEQGAKRVEAYPLTDSWWIKQKPTRTLPDGTFVFENPAAQTTPAKLDDFGEKIGGARKDTAQKTGTTRRAESKSSEPAWAKKFVPMENSLRPGEWSIVDTTKKHGGRWSVQKFTSEAEARAAVPLYAVAQSHTIRPEGDKFVIVKRVTDRKMLKVVNQEFDSREAAMEYMARNANAILEMKTSFGEEILPAPEIAVRKGKEYRTTDATPEMFMETFAPRGIEFGNWNNQDERQQVLNHAYDGLMDLAEVLNIPPKALMLNGELAIAFGARGQGLSGAKAHYESKFAAINLTKMTGAGSLAHEWMHAFDHYLARLDGKAASERVQDSQGNLVYPDTNKPPQYRFQSEGINYRSKLRPELRKAYEALVEGMFRKAQTYVEDTTRADRFLETARNEVDRQLKNVRNVLERDDSQYKKGKFGQPASDEILAEFDKLANVIREGGSLEVKWLTTDGKGMKGRYTNDTLEAISNVLKRAKNRAGWDATNRSGVMDALVQSLKLYKQRIQMFEDAESGTEKKKTVPTDYAIEARKMDQARSGDYWSTPREMIARAFASYTEDRFADRGVRSEFMVYRAKGGIILPMIDGFIARPYPEGAERIAVNALFDTFVNEIKTRETERGVEMYRTADMPGFYSAAARAVEGMKQDTFTPAQLKGMIQNAQGVKAEELVDLGLFDWLDGIEGKVSKAEVLAFIENAGPQVVEVTKGEEARSFPDGYSFRPDPAYSSGIGDVIDPNGRAIHDASSEREAMLYAQRHAGVSTDTKFSQYQLPGGENYREVLLTLPEKMVEKIRYNWVSDDGRKVATYDSEAEAIERKSKDGGTVKPVKGTTHADPGYTSSHWDEPNVLAHVRLNDRTGPNGEKVLFIEEIQSDWHQEGRKKGYRAGDPKAEYHKALAEMVERRDSLDEGSEEWSEAARAVNRIQMDGPEVMASAPPPAPFKKSWAMLAFKRVLRMAAEQGYDSVAWTPGDVQAERYDLSKQVDTVQYDPDAQQLLAYQANNTTPVIKQTVPVAELENHVGKEVAQKIVDKMEDHDSAYGRFITLKNADLKVGGDGMRGFYDKILPAEVGKYVKKMGGKVETNPVALESFSTDFENFASEFHDKPFDQLTEGQVRQARGYFKAQSKPSTIDVWTVNLTPAMRTQIMEGQPLYREGQDTTPTAEQTEQARALLREMLGDAVSVETVDRLTTPEGRKALGKYRAAWITLAEGGDMEGTAYHEAVHAALDLFLTADERARLLADVRREGMTDIQAEEALAENFVRYAKDRSGFRGAVKRVAAKVLRALRALVTGEVRPIDRVNAFYDSLQSGQMARGQAQAQETGMQTAQAFRETDTAYLAAVEAGDMEAAQRMVDEAARAAGYESPKVYHWTHNDFTEFDRDLIGSANSNTVLEGFFFADKPLPTGRGGKNISAYLNLKNPIIIDIRNSNFDSVGAQEAVQHFVKNQTYDYLLEYLVENEGYSEEAANDVLSKWESADGVILKNVAYDAHSNEYIVFNPSQIKSADAIVRDNTGRVIPLSERFNQQSDDIRFRTEEQAAIPFNAGPRLSPPSQFSPIAPEVIEGTRLNELVPRNQEAARAKERTAFIERTSVASKTYDRPEGANIWVESAAWDENALGGVGAWNVTIKSGNTKPRSIKYIKTFASAYNNPDAAAAKALAVAMANKANAYGGNVDVWQGINILASATTEGIMRFRLNQSGAFINESGKVLPVGQNRNMIEGEMYRTEAQAAETARAAEQVQKAADEAREWVASFFDRRPDTNARPDVTKANKMFGTIFHYARKVPALQRMFDSANRLRDNKHLYGEEIFGEGERHLGNLNAFAKTDKVEGQALKDYIFQRDIDAEGYTVRKDGERFEVVDPSGKAVMWMATEEAAWGEAFTREAEDYQAAGHSAEAAAALKTYRQIAARMYDQLMRAAREVEAKMKEMGEDMPKVEGRDLFDMLREMGDRRGHYMPRIRKSGKWVLKAEKVGANPIREHFDTRPGRSKRARQLERDGYTTKFEVSTRPSEDAYLDAGLVAINDLIRNTMERMNESADNVTLDSLGMKNRRIEYKRKTDGVVENHLIIDNRDSNGKIIRGFSSIFKEFGGSFYDDKQTNTGEVWHFVNPTDTLARDLARAMFRHQHTVVKPTLAFTDMFTKQIAELIHSRGSRSSKIARAPGVGKDVWLGYEADPFLAITRAGKSTAGGTAKRQMAQEFMKIITGTDVDYSEFRRDFLEKNPVDPKDPLTAQLIYEAYQAEVDSRRIDSATQGEAYEEAMSFSREMLRNETGFERIMGSIRGITAIKHLSGIASGLVNFSTMMTVVPATMHHYGQIPLRATARLIAKGQREYAKFYLNQRFGKGEGVKGEENQWLMQQISSRGWDSALFNEESIKVLQNQLQRGWSKAADMMLIAYGITERANRGGTIAAAYYGLREQGMSRDAALTKAKEISDNSHSIFGKANLPSWARGGSMQAQLTRNFYMYMSYVHNWHQVLGETLKTKDYKSAAFLLLAPAILAGPAATYVTFPVTLAAKAIFGMMGMEPPEDVEEAFYRWVEETFGDTTGRFARTGLAGGLTGIDLRGSLRADIMRFVPQDINGLMGAPYALVEDVKTAVQQIGRGNPMKAAEALAPRILSGPIRAVREATEGVTSNNNQPVFYGDSQLKAGFTDSVLRFLSFNPANLSIKRERQWAEMAVERDYSEKRTEIYARMRRWATADGSSGGWLDVLNDIEEYNAKVRASRFRGNVPFITEQTIRRQFTNLESPHRRERVRMGEVGREDPGELDFDPLERRAGRAGRADRSLRTRRNIRREMRRELR